jgi:hypothetical protein
MLRCGTDGLTAEYPMVGEMYAQCPHKPVLAGTGEVWYLYWTKESDDCRKALKQEGLKLCMFTISVHFL